MPDARARWFETVDELVAWLASPQAAYVSGAVWPIDGAFRG